MLALVLGVEPGTIAGAAPEPPVPARPAMPAAVTGAAPMIGGVCIGPSLALEHAPNMTTHSHQNDVVTLVV